MSDLNALHAKAAAGDAEAQHALGLRLLTAKDAPFQPKEGAAWVRKAASQNFAPALRLAAVFATVGFEGAEDWDEALRLLDAADARAEREVLGAPFDLAAWRTPPAAKDIFASPRVAVIEGFLAPHVCDWIVGRARPKLEAAQVYDPIAGGKRPGERRTNTGTGFGLAESDLVLQAVNERIAAATGLARVQQEATNVLHYEPGQEFLPHFDSLDPKVAHFARDLALNGQRVATFLIYLNDDFDGGETEFPRLDWRFRGAKGDALMFWNVGADGLPDEQALHAGLAPTRGEKWLLSKWVRSKPLPLI